MRRVSVVGNSAAGKSTYARALAVQLDVAHVELDAIFHQPGWSALPTPQFRSRVSDLVAGEGWVIDGNYSRVQDVVWACADTVIWLDPPRHTVMWRVLRRTFVRLVSRRELWNGNREDWRNLLHWNDDNIICWAWRHYAHNHERYTAAMTDPAYAHLHFVRLAHRCGRFSAGKSTTTMGKAVRRR